MSHLIRTQDDPTWENILFGVSSLLSILCIVYILLHPSPYSITVPEVVLPFVVSLALITHTLRLKQKETPPNHSELIVKYALGGVVCSLAFGGSEFLLQLAAGVPTSTFPDTILSFVSIGIVTGAVSGQLTSTRRHPQKTDRGRILSETSWIRQSGQAPILNAVVDALLEIEGSDVDELEPLYTHIDPDVLAELKSHDGSPWQLTFFTDDHEIRISSQGTVTVYATETGVGG